jgi:hypothetical protein
MKFLRALAIPALTAGSLIAVPQAAYGVVDQVCAVEEVVTYNPPLTDTPQTVTVTVHGELFNCTSTSNPTGSYTEIVTVPNSSCLSLLGSSSGVRTYVWRNSTTYPASVFSYNRTVNRVDALVEATFLGSITSGSYTPSPAKEVVFATAPSPIACQTTGVSSVTSVGAVSIGV